jgi:Tol biopolymer transport system component
VRPRYLALGAASLLLLIVAAVLLPRGLGAVRSATKSGGHAPAGLIEPRPPSLYYTVRSEDTAAVFAVTGSGGPRSFAGGEERAGALISPDGRRAVSLRAACPRCAAVYELDDLQTGHSLVIGDVPPQLLFGAAGAQAAWSADGRYLAFVEHGLDASVDRIFLYDVYSGVRRPLTTQDPAAQLEPAWSPDGRRVAYLAGAEQTVVSTADVDTGEVRQLNDQLDHAGSLSWSPNGAYLAVQHGGQVWLVEAADGHGFPLPGTGNVTAVGGWSPSSQALLIVESHDTAGQSSDLLVAPLSGTVVRITAGDRIGTPRWSRDGGAVAWAVNQGNGWSVWTAPAAGGALRRVASGSGSVALSDWR